MAADLRGDLLGAANHLTARWVTSPAGILAQWAGVLAGPITFAADELISYALVQWSCGHQNRTVLHLITLVSLALIAGGAWSAWHVLGETPDDMSYDPDGEAGVVAIRLARARFMAVLGLMMCAFFATLTIAAGVPPWVLDAC